MSARLQILTLVLALIAPLSSKGDSGTLREVIVSHADENGVLQLYRANEDGSGKRQLTSSSRGCRMPSVSPDGKKLLYVEQVDHQLAIMLSDIDGGNARKLVGEGMNLLPSWVPDGRHIVWMKSESSNKKQDPASSSQIHIMDIKSGGTRRLFNESEQVQFNNSMPSVSPKGQWIAFVSDRSGPFRVWVSKLDGSEARMVSTPPVERHKQLDLPFEQKVPCWSPDGKWIAHWEGVEMIHMSPYTGIQDPKRDQQISATFHVWVCSSEGGKRRKVGRGDDPTWSPDGFVTRAFPDPKRGGPMIVVETKTTEKEMPIVPHRKNWGRFTWLPHR